MRREPTFEPTDEDDETYRPLSRPRPLGRMRLAGRFVFAAALIAGLTVAGLDRMRAAPDTAATGPFKPANLGRAPDRATATEPALLRLDPAEGEPAAAEPPRWSPATGLREDSLASGRFEAIEAPFLRLTLSENAPEAGAGPSLFVTLARRAAEMQGLSVLRTGLRGQVETKFGPFETVETTLAGTGHRTCLGFRSLALRQHRIDGWLCGILGQAPEPRAVACTLNRLRLAGRTDPIVEAAFAEADARREAGCESVAPGRAADTTGSIARAAPGATARARKK